MNFTGKRVEVRFRTEDDRRLYQRYLKNIREKTGDNNAGIAMKAIQHYYQIIDENGNLK